MDSLQSDADLPLRQVSPQRGAILHNAKLKQRPNILFDHSPIYGYLEAY